LVFNEFMQKGNIPWYINYEDLGKLFKSAKKYAGANVGMQPEVMEMIASLVARNPDNRKQYYRTSVLSVKDAAARPPAFVGLISVRYSATNTMTKLGGSYFSKGVTSALIDPSERSERIETILRK
jgi:hypothetical protein